MVSTRRIGRRFRLPSPVVLTTLIVLVAVYIAMGIGMNVSGAGADWPPFQAMLLSPSAVMHGELWRLVSYGLLHDPTNPMHIALNGLMLYFFGRDLEERFGKLKFALYLVGGVVAGGVMVMIANLIGFHSVAIGFSGAVEACTVTWALLNRNAQVMLFFALPMRGIHMLWLAVAQFVLDAVSLSPIAASAHLGGILFGVVVWLFVARRNRLKLFVDDALVKLRLRRGPRLTVVPKNNDRWVN